MVLLDCCDGVNEGIASLGGFMDRNDTDRAGAGWLRFAAGRADVEQVRERVIAQARQSVNDPDNAATITRGPADQQYTAEIQGGTGPGVGPTAIHERPELSQILFQLADAKIQQDVAQNQTLPRLDLKGQVKHYGLDGDAAGGYRQMDGDYYEYRVGLEFEQPIGNRAAEAAYLRTRLTEQSRNIRYRNETQDVVLSVKDALAAGEPGNRDVRAKLKFADPVIDPASQTFRCVFAIDNAAPSLPAGFVVQWREAGMGGDGG